MGRLRVSKVQLRDRGFYHCQLATHPPQVIWTYLDIVRPFFRIYNSENGTLEDQHYHRGSKIGLQCEVGRAPLQDSSVQWVFQGERGRVVLNEDVKRGGVLIQTWRLDEDTLLSNLTLHRAGPGDKGNYTCSLPGELSALGDHTVRVHILDYELPVAVHSGFGERHQGFWVLGMVLTIADWWREALIGHRPNPTRL